MELDFADCWNLASGKEFIVKNFTNWTSGSEIIDNFIQEKQLKYDEDESVFEWIPYNELLDIKEIGDNCLTTAIFKNGPLYYKERDKEWIRESFEKVCIRYLHNSQDNDEFLNEIESYLLHYGNYGISQNPDTKDYILIFSGNYLDYFCEKCNNKYDEWTKWCKCQINHLENDFTNWTSGNKIIDNFIKEKQLKFNGSGAVFEWIPYSELIVINEVEKSVIVTAIRKDGQLYYDIDKKEWTRKLNEKVILRFLYDLQNINEYEFLNKVESYLYNEDNEYLNGISQNPDTNVYILIFSEVFFEYYYCVNCANKYLDKYHRICNQCQFKNNFTNWSSGNKIIDNFIQEKQLKYNGDGSVFEWILFNELIIIKEIEDSCSTIAILKNGSLYYEDHEKGWIRKPCEKVCLKYLYNSHDITDEFITEIKPYTDDCYGFSQNPDTKEYILVFSYKHFDNYCIKCGNKYENEYVKWCKQCQINQLKNNFTIWTSGNKKIDEFIQNSQSRISEHSDTVFEWIPYNKFININETGKSGFTIAIWKDGPLYYSSSDGKYKRKLYRKVLLKYWYNLQNINVFFNEIIHLINESYGISQILNTNDFILILQPKYYCENCGSKYNNKFEIDNKSCISCQTNHESKKIRDLIQEMRLNINHNFNSSDKIFEWIPYDQFSNIEEIGKGGFSTVYLAIWKDGLLVYDDYNKRWKRKLNTKVALKCLHNSQNSLDEFINKIKAYPRQIMANNIINLYGISQDSNTKDYIIVFEFAEGGNFNNYLDKNYESFDWFNGLKVLTNIINNLSKIHQEKMVHHNFHIGNILFASKSSYNKKMAYISDIGLYRKIDDIDETSIYGVIPYVAPEVLKGKPYTQAADIYSFGMIMYVIATGRQPYTDCAHDEVLVLNICNGIRPEINEKIAPKCYIDLMKRCWDLDLENRPNSNEIKEMIESFCNSLDQKFKKREQNYHEIEFKKKEQQYHEIEEQFKETEEFRKVNQNYLILLINMAQEFKHIFINHQSKKITSLKFNLEQFIIL
ncbi:unnamed protein product [Rhizophagus irregularis]|nr:unnamed protein product [Rhizophagus irregularis]